MLDKVFLKKISIFSLLLLLVACATGGRKERDALRNLVVAGEYQKAIEYLKKNDFYKEEDVKLLKLMEMGLIEHISGNYHQSIQVLNQAKEVHDKLFTKSISKKAQTYVLNDTYDKYYGFVYERSLIHFYLSLNHYLLYQQGTYQKAIITPDEKEQKFETIKLTANEKRQRLLSARAELLGWDSYLESLNHKRVGRSVFKIDLLAKTYGAFVHETVGTVNDQRIALQLYKDAKKYLFRNYNSYPTFNQSSIKFKQDFEKLPKLKKKDVAEKYVEQTVFQKNLKNFLDYKILSLTKTLSPRDYKTQVRRQAPNKSVLAKIKKNGKRRSNLAIIFQRGFIPKKVGAKQYYGLKAVLDDPNASDGAKAAAAIGSIALTVFAANQLGLTPAPENWTPVGARMGIHVASAAVNNAAIAFELPEIKNEPIDEKLFIEFYDKNEKLVKRKLAPVINPMGDIAAEAVAEDSAARYGRVGVRLATKHILAIVAAHQIYESQKEKMGKGFARMLAVGSYLAASKGIENSEKADTRYWSTLPADIRFTDLYLPKGTYSVKASLVAMQKQGNEEVIKKVYNLGKIKVKKKAKTLINFRSR